MCMDDMVHILRYARLNIRTVFTNVNQLYRRSFPPDLLPFIYANLLVSFFKVGFCSFLLLFFFFKEHHKYRVR